jgi:hypothetical protein
MSGSHADRQLVRTGITKHYSAGVAQNLRTQRARRNSAKDAEKCYIEFFCLSIAEADPNGASGVYDLPLRVHGF